MNKLDKKGQLNIGMIITLFMGIMVSMSLFGSIADTTSQMTTKQSTSNQSVSTVTAYIGDNEVNESINFTAYTQSAWKQLECPLESVAIRNGAGTALVADTDYTLYASQGVYSLLNTSSTVPGTALNLTYVDYTYCADGYNTSSSSRTIANLVLIFCALIILGFVLLGVNREWF